MRRAVRHARRTVPAVSAELSLHGSHGPRIQRSIRELIYGSYRIIYKVTEQVCSILAIIHGSRDILKHLKAGDWKIE